jgi:mannosyltransferase
MGSTILSKASASAGAVLLLTAFALPASAFIEFLRGDSASGDAQLLLGGEWFKISLALLGLAVIVLGRLSIWDSPAQNVKSSFKPRSKLALAFLAVILLAATALRLYRLDTGLWLDEILTDVLFAKAPLGTIVTTFQSENQHFLYSLLAHISLQVFGDTAWALRLPAVLFGIGSIWSIYLLGREVAGEREGLLSAALLGFSYQHIWFSQNARGYSGLLFWTILSSWLLLRALRGGKPVLWLLYAIAAALGVYTHVTMVFVIAGQLAVYLTTLWAQRKQSKPLRWLGLVLGFGMAGLFTLQLYALVIPQVIAGMGRETSLVEEWKNPLWTLVELIKGAEISFASGIVAAAAFLVFGAGLISYARTKPEILELLFIPSILCAVVVIGLGHHLWPRFFFFALGFGALVVIRGAMVVGDLGARVFKLPSFKSGWAGTALCVSLVFFAALSIRYVYGPKQDYDGALNLVQAEKQPGDAVVTASLTAFVYRDFYGMDWPEVKTLGELNAIRTQAKRTWLVYTFEPVLESERPEIAAALRRDFTVVRQFDGTVSDGSVFVARSDVQPSKPSAVNAVSRRSEQ